MALHIWLLNKAGSIITIFIYFLVFVLILGIIQVIFSREEIKNNWSHYRCKPYIIPLSGFIKKEEGKNIIESTILNLNGCLWITIKHYFDILAKPIVFILDIVKSLVKILTTSIDKVRGQIKVIRNMILGIVIGVMKRLENVMIASTFTYAKINDVLKRQLAIYQNLVYLMESIGVTMDGFVKGTVGTMLDMSEWGAYVLPVFTLGPAGAVFPAMAFCFHPNTLMDNKKYIKDINLGDEINTNNTVISKLKFRMPPNITLYNYNNIIMSGWHYVYNNNKWKKVKDCTNPIVKLVKSDTDYLYNISTTTNIISINNDVFLDYDENNMSESINQKILALLNRNTLTYDNLQRSKHHFNKRYRLGFARDTLINGTAIQDIDLDASNNILGFIEHITLKDNDVFYYYKGVICSEYVKVFVEEEQIWKNVRDVSNTVVDYNEDVFYNICTSNNIIEINGCKFRDFIEIDNPKDLQDLDELYSAHSNQISS